MEDGDEEQIDAWGDLGARYRYDSHAQFVLFVEQLAVTRELLTAHEVSKQRMALVAVDNLAELVLHRHKRRLVDAAQESWRDVEPRLSSNDEQRLHRSFDARVDFGLRGAGPGLLELHYTPVLDSLDAALFRVGHRYRNRVYHADHHNAAALALLARAYFAAVARAFVRLQPDNIASSMSRSTKQALRAYGYEGSTQSWLGPRDELLAPAEAARVITARLCDDIDVDFTTARDVLTQDLLRRVEWTRQMIHALLTDGMPEERLEWGLRWIAHWREISLDPQIVDLELRMRAQWRQGVDGRDNEWRAAIAREADLNTQRNERVTQLLSERRATSFDLPERTRKLAGQASALSGAKNLGSLIDRYERLDTAMGEIEEILDEAAIGWDRWVQDECDRLRGK